MLKHSLWSNKEEVEKVSFNLMNDKTTIRVRDEIKEMVVDS